MLIDAAPMSAAPLRRAHNLPATRKVSVMQVRAEVRKFTTDTLTSAATSVRRGPSPKRLPTRLPPP